MSAEPAPPDEPFAVEIGDTLDLHTFAPRDIPGVVESYIEAARERGFREVRLIHGKGTGFQRERVRATLATLPSVAGFRDAPGDRGHWGATLVSLHSPRGEAGEEPR